MSTREIALSSEIEMALKGGAVCAIGVSGGKDSHAAAVSTARYLDDIRHQGPRVCVHADLGAVEWEQSMPMCEAIATIARAELLVVRRKAGDMMDRWEARWESSVRRYAELETVTLVLPWSTPGMRFCTAELKTQAIEAELKRRFPGRVIVNVTGVRREESPARSRATISSLGAPSRSGFVIHQWRPIVDWTLQDVKECIATSGIAWHPAYELGMSRVSCVACIMSSIRDLEIATRVPANADIIRRMVALELRSSFAFQGGRWLGDVAHHLLNEPEKKQLIEAKEKAAQRANIEQAIPKDLRYTKGWPERVPSPSEAGLLASARAQVGRLIGIPVKYTTRDSVVERYQALMLMKQLKSAA